MRQDPITTNFADFGSSERRDVREILNAWNEQGLPKDFEEDGTHFALNRESGCLFLTNSEYQVAMMNGSKLEMWYSCSNCGHEGFSEDCELNDDGCNECNLQDEEEEEE